MTTIINGTKLAKELEVKLKIKVQQLKNKGIISCLGILVFKGDRGGEVYSQLKQKAAARVGIKVVISNSDTDLTVWNQDSKIHGIMIQRPGFRGEDFEQEWQRLVDKIKPEKDVDGLRENSLFIPATVKAVESILTSVNIPPRGGMLVVGRGMIGKQLAKRFQVMPLSSQDKDLKNRTKTADILICATGHQNLIRADMVKNGAIVIDVGWPKGDVDFKNVQKIAGYITPVPGGVGPVTVISLLENLVTAVYNS